MKKLLRNPLISGAFLLTASGIVTKIIGFFYRIFLARIFHEEGLGVLGLISPVMLLVHSVSAAGFQNAITRHVAASKQDKREGYGYLLCGALMSVSLSVALSISIYTYADFIALQLIGETRTAPLLRIVALSFPLASLHTCINGYFYGYQKAGIPASSLIIEQCFRVIALWLQTFGKNITDTPLLSRHRFVKLVRLACPLSMNRVCMSLFATLETLQLPRRLVESGLEHAAALSLYGVFSGMAFPLVMFPCAITGSAATLLLPVISEAQAQHNCAKIRNAVLLTLGFCLLLGFGCMCFFLTFAELLGHLLFDSAEAASQIRALSLVCPFLYLSGMLSSILTGLGKPTLPLIFNLLSTSLRLLFVHFIIPRIGFAGYFYGILFSQILLDLLLILALRRIIVYNSYG